MLPTRRAFVRSLMAGPFVVGSLAAQEAKLPVTGVVVEPLAPFDELMTTFLEEQKIPGAALAVARDGKVIYARGFGYADPERKEKVEPMALFRISSVSKTLTGAAILRLVELGKLGLDDKALDLLPLEPVGRVDARWKKITIKHLLQHTAGFDREKSGEVTGKPLEVANALRVPTPVTAVHMVRDPPGRPLDFEPGSKFAYANPGYLVLGRIIEAVSRTPYEAFVKKEILSPLNLSMQMGRELFEHRARGEVRYFDRKKVQGKCLYPPRAGIQVPIMYGAFNFEAFDSFGGWLSSAPDLVRFASAYDDAEKCPILKAKSIEAMWSRPDGPAGMDGDKPAASYYNGGWSYRPVSATKGNAWHEGGMPGAAALVTRTAVNISWSVLFNMDTTLLGAPLSAAIEPLLGQAALKVTTWPDKDVLAR